MKYLTQFWTIVDPLASIVTFFITNEFVLSSQNPYTPTEIMMTSFMDGPNVFLHSSYPDNHNKWPTGQMWPTKAFNFARQAISI